MKNICETDWRIKDSRPGHVIWLTVGLRLGVFLAFFVLLKYLFGLRQQLDDQRLQLGRCPFDPLGLLPLNFKNILQTRLLLVRLGLRKRNFKVQSAFCCSILGQRTTFCLYFHWKVKLLCGQFFLRLEFLGSLPLRGFENFVRLVNVSISGHLWVKAYMFLLRFFDRSREALFEVWVSSLDRKSACRRF